MNKVTYLNNDKMYSYREITPKESLVGMGTLRAACFTGHRPTKLCGYVSLEEHESIISKVASEVLHLYKEGYRKFITGGAQGFDQLAFHSIRIAKRRYNIKDIVNSVYVPFVGQESCWRDTGPFSKEEWYNMLDAADEVRIVNDKVLPVDPYYNIVRALDDRNKAMLRDSSILIAWYQTGSKGGTLNCIKEALMLGMEVRNLYEADYVTV